jgi:predicted transcriptional regulator
VQRLNLIKFLWEFKAIEYLNSWVQTKEIADAVNMPGSTTKNALEDLMVTGTLNRKRGESEGGRPPYSWQITEQVADWITAADLFTGTFNKEYT